MRWLSLLAGCVAICLLIVVGRAWAQTPLAPSITQVFVYTNYFDVFWSAPADNGGPAIVAYDLRYIRSDHPDKTDDANWTVEEVWVAGDGTLVHDLKDLPDGTKYDLQVRADNGSDGPWSTPIYEATTTDHSNSRSSATLLALGSSVRGSIDPADDEDYFQVALAADGDLWVYTTGSDDTVGRVVSTGGVIAGDDDGQLLDGPLNFSIREELLAGTYYVRVTSFDARETASYTIHAQLATDPGNTKDTATTVSLDSITPGRIGPQGGMAGDKDYFKLELSAAADVWVMAVGDLDTVGQLLDADEMVLEEGDDSGYINNETGFMVRRELGVGTYYIRVRSYVSDDVGPYTLFVRTATDPGSSTTTATPITLGTPEPGRIRPSSDQDYFSLTVDEDTYVYVYGLSFGDALPLTPTVTDSSNTVLDDLHVIAHEHWAHNGIPEASFSVWARLAAGTYYIRVQAPSGGTGGPYLLHALESTYGRTVDRCTGITTAQSDPWYGCAWHLNNTGQFTGGAGRDINVEEVWATTMGAGINIAVVDDGLQYAHDDLAPNVRTARNHDYYGSDIYDPLETHGTRVAGIIAARDNDIGVRGVAPRASIYGYNLIDINDTEALDEANAMTRDMSDTAVNNNSWGPPEVIGFAWAAWGDAIVNGVTNGFGGKGVFYVFAAGNDFTSGQDGNLDEYANHYGVTGGLRRQLQRRTGQLLRDRLAPVGVRTVRGRGAGLAGDRNNAERRPLHGLVLRHLGVRPHRLRRGGTRARRERRPHLARRQAHPRRVPLARTTAATEVPAPRTAAGSRAHSSTARRRSATSSTTSMASAWWTPAPPSRWPMAGRRRRTSGRSRWSRVTWTWRFQRLGRSTAERPSRLP